MTPPEPDISEGRSINQNRDTSSLILRSATSADIPAIQNIYAYHVLKGTGSFEEIPPSVEEMEERRRAVRNKKFPYLVVSDQMEILGFAYVAPFRPRSAYRWTVEDSIYVAHHARGRGLGRLLLSSLIEECRALELREIVAVIGDSENRSSIMLHERLGFVLAGTLHRVGYKFGRFLDVVLMQHCLVDDTRSRTEIP